MIPFLYLFQPVFVKGEAGAYSSELERDEEGTVKGFESMHGEA